jgi:hypothetical protein
MIVARMTQLIASAHTSNASATVTSTAGAM